MIGLAFNMFYVPHKSLQKIQIKRNNCYKVSGLYPSDISLILFT